MKSRTRPEWVALIEDTAHGRVSWNSQADCSPWDSFYSDYRAASVEIRQEIDDAFLECLDSADPRVVEEALIHPFMSAPVAATTLLRLLDERSAFLLAHAYLRSDQNLLARTLNSLASCGETRRLDSPLLEQVREAILHWVPTAGPLRAGIGTFFGDLGPEAADRLAAALPAELDHTQVMKDVGY
ncbi:MAG: hypothetical protein KA205_06620, partial [Acidobacteria bacterium]|nr:hypothetical protein [Acidobacteriota bacterium]